MNSVTCRVCKEPLKHVFVDLGMSPLANSYLTTAQLEKGEVFYPLRPYVCHKCLLVQLPEFESPEEIFSDYAYLSSYSDAFLAHAESYVDMAVHRFGLNPKSRVVELASNDGYLLQYFVRKGVPVLGVEPAANVAKVAVSKGVPTVCKFFGVATADEFCREGQQADLIVANNVLAHVPDLNDFVRGMKVLLRVGGVITVEVPHLMKLMAHNQFDTIYHEHFSYFSLFVVEDVFMRNGLKVFDVEEIWTHGGSLRVFACHAEESAQVSSQRLLQLRAREKAEGFDALSH